MSGAGVDRGASVLRVEQLSLSAADLGQPNPLPPLVNEREIHDVELGGDIAFDIQQNLGYGRVPNCLPYTTLDGYSRDRAPRSMTSIVLENGHLKATFLPELGGRLWSLVHKPSDRELLTVNESLRFCNLALRNAWFSGGVEWNIGTTGHSPFTCSPVFAAAVQGSNGAQILRIYEWERIRQVPFQIDFYLDDELPALFVHTRIINPHDHEIPMYWWSNMAVPESEGTRVVVPSEETYRFAYDDQLTRLPVPCFDGLDCTYSTESTYSADYFFRVIQGQRPWIAALDRDGTGLVQTSTNRLSGRKLFVWGAGVGGRRWQEFLGGPDAGYLEMQAGLTTTQLEHVPMPAQTEWDWLEAYALLDVEKGAVHSARWDESRSAVESRLEEMVPRSRVEEELERARTWQHKEPSELLHMGSGWGRLELERRSRDGETPFVGNELRFPPDSIGREQEPWLELLTSGVYPENGFSQQAPSFMVQPEWSRLLEASLTKEPRSWAALLHLGVAYAYIGEWAAARAAWIESLEHERTPWALRNLAVDDRRSGLLDDAVDRLIEASGLAPDSVSLATELGRGMIEAGRSKEWLEAAALPNQVAAHGRIRYLNARAGLECGELSLAAQFFDSGEVVTDLREGSTEITQLWVDYQTQLLARETGQQINAIGQRRVAIERPVPDQFDFSMTPPNRSEGCSGS